MNHQAAILMARLAMNKWELDDWKVVINPRLKRALGVCKYRTKSIELSAEYVTLNGEAEVRDTILHEIAHAKAGHKAGHGPEWKSWCLRVGAKPERCAPADTPAAKAQWQLAARINGELVRFAHKAHRRTDMSRRFIRGRKEETLGKLIWVEAE